MMDVDERGHGPQPDGTRTSWSERLVGAACLASIVAVAAIGLASAADGTTVVAPPTRATGTAIDLNTAGAEELAALPKIGPTLAERIVRRRAEVGPFTSVDELDEVPGVGPALLEAVRPWVVVGSSRIVAPQAEEQAGDAPSS
jgi:competence ComEA-like helix-hairpin-helix protein